MAQGHMKCAQKVFREGFVRLHFMGQRANFVQPCTNGVMQFEAQGVYWRNGWVDAFRKLVGGGS